MVKRICKNCKKEFNSWFKEGKLYSRGKNMGTSFRGRFCSRKCQVYYSIGENNGSWNSLKKECLFCHKIFFIPVSLVNSGGGKHCSKTCYDTSRKATIIKKECAFCKKIINVRKSKLKQLGRGNYCSRRCANKASIGEKAHNWQGGICPLNKRIRKSEDYELWRQSVYKRDNYTCQLCENETGGNLHAHHIKKFSDNPELRTDINNGITLCDKCHISKVTWHEEDWENLFIRILKNKNYD